MPFHLFKSKRRGTPKSNTTKKAESVQNPSPQGDLNAGSDRHVVNITNVGAWVKENAVDDRPHSASAVLKGKEPDRATLVNEVDAPHTISAQEATREECDTEDALENGTTDTPDEEPQQQPMTDLILGRRDPTSSYFTQRHITLPATALPSSVYAIMSIEETSNLGLVDLDPHAFEFFQIWRYTGTISSRCQLPYSSDTGSGHNQTWSICWPLLNAHILGYKLDAPNFADQVMDLLVEKPRGSSSPDIEIIKHLFTKGDDISRILKTFVADKYIDAKIGGLEDVDINALPPAFLRLALQRAVVKLSGTASTLSAAGCRYHIHAAPEQCYKQNFSPQELRRQLRLDLDRQKSSSDAQELMRNFKDNDIKTVDWEERRAKALRATTHQATLIEDVFNTAQTGPAADATANMMTNRGGSTTTASTGESAETTKFLHPSLTQDADGNLGISSTPASLSGPVENTYQDGERYFILPGTFPGSRYGR